MTRNAGLWETVLLKAIVDRMVAVLPSYWSVQVDESPRNARPDADAFMTIASSRARVDLAVEVKSSLSMPSTALMSQLARLREQTERDVLLVSDYINPIVRAKCAEGGFSYADTTGWLRLESRQNSLFVLSEGAARAEPSGRETDISRLNGVGASRVVRAMLQLPAPLGVRELADLARVSPGSVSKVLPTLAAAGCVERDEGGRVVLVRRRELVERWVQDYRFAATNRVTWWLAARGLGSVTKGARTLPDAVATGSLVTRAALPEEVMSVTPLTLAAFYVADPQPVVDTLRLVPTDPSRANVVLAVPRDAELLADATRRREVPIAQAIADLLTLPGRSVEEAEQAMDLLGRSDPSWLREGSAT